MVGHLVAWENTGLWTENTNVIGIEVRQCGIVSSVGLGRSEFRFLHRRNADWVTLNPHSDVKLVRCPWAGHHLSA